MNIALISVYGTKDPERTMYEGLLYDLLKERKPYQNISHKKLPTFRNHVKFVRSRPYKGLYILQDLENRQFVGSIYLGMENNIGLFIFDKFNHKGYGTKALSVLYELYPHVKQMYANVAPNNCASMAFFLNKRFNFHSSLICSESLAVIQYTYATINPCYVSSEQL